MLSYAHGLWLPRIGCLRSSEPRDQLCTPPHQPLRYAVPTPRGTPRQTGTGQRPTPQTHHPRPTTTISPTTRLNTHTHASRPGIPIRLSGVGTTAPPPSPLRGGDDAFPRQPGDWSVSTTRLDLNVGVAGWRRAGQTRCGSLPVGAAARARWSARGGSAATGGLMSGVARWVGGWASRWSEVQGAPGSARPSRSRRWLR